MKKSFAFEHSKNKNAVVLLFFSLFLCCFFIFTNNARAAERSIIISAVRIEGQIKNDDLIEIYNNTCSNIDVSGWKLRSRNGSEKATENSIKEIDAAKIIPAKGYFLWSHSDIANSYNPDQKSGSSLSENYSIALFNKSGDLIDSLTWGNNKNPFSNSLVYSSNPLADETLLRNTSDEFSVQTNYKPKNSSVVEEDEYESCPDAEAEEEEESPSDENSTDTNQTYSSGVRLNEILPNPKGDEKEGEFIELYNEENFSVNLKGWTLKDASKTKFVFPSDETIGAGNYLAVYRNDFKFALNNTGPEDVFLLDPNGDIVSETTYDGAKEDVSFSFDGSGWRWSKYLTPGKTNKFGASSKLKAMEIKKGYVGVPVEFSLDAENDNFSKVTWDFGDKKKSYLKNPTHIYFKKGKYKIKVSASGETENISDSFTLKIEDYPRKKVEILAIMPNPFGKDLGQEWIELKNNEKEAVNLKDWKIATGQFTLINHLIKAEFEIGPGESRQITREDTFFTLHNTGMTLELRYPDGKTADKLTYAKDKIADDEIYIKDEVGWIWFSAEEEAENEEVLDFEEAESPIETETLHEEDPQGEVLGVSTELGKFSTSEEWENKKRNKSHYLNYGLHIELASDFSEKTYSNNSLASKPLPAHAENEAFLEINAFLNKLLFN